MIQIKLTFLIKDALPQLEICNDTSKANFPDQGCPCTVTDMQSYKQS